MEQCRNLVDGQFMKDFHLHDLLVFPAGTDLHNSEVVMEGSVVLQDKVKVQIS